MAQICKVKKVLLNGIDISGIVRTVNVRYEAGAVDLVELTLFVTAEIGDDGESITLNG